MKKAKAIDVQPTAKITQNKLTPTTNCGMYFLPITVIIQEHEAYLYIRCDNTRAFVGRYSTKSKKHKQKRIRWNNNYTVISIEYKNKQVQLSFKIPLYTTQWSKHFIFSQVITTFNKKFGFPASQTN